MSRTEPHGWSAMSAPFMSFCMTSPKVPTGPRAADLLAEAGREMGIERLSPEEAAALPPWTEEEAAAFERAVAEAGGEVVDAQTGRWPPLP